MLVLVRDRSISAAVMKMSPEYLFTAALSAMSRLSAKIRRSIVGMDPSVLSDDEAAVYWVAWQAYAIGVASR